MLAIEYARNERQRKSCYRDLLKVARNTLGYSRRAISWIDVHGIELELLPIAGQLRHYCDLAEKVINCDYVLNIWLPEQESKAGL